MARPVSTYSIVACDLDAGQWGVAVQSKFLAVGSVVPWAEPEVGRRRDAVVREPALRPGRARAPAAGAVRRRGRQRLTEADDGRDERQLGVVDAQGRGATFTGSACHDWAGGRTGAGLRGAGEHPRLRRRPSTRSPRRSSRRAGSLAERLLDGARGGAGGRRRQARPAVGGAARRRARRRLRGPLRHRSSTCASTTTRRRSRSSAGSTSCTSSSSARRRAQEWLPVDDELRAEIDERLARLGYERLEDWAGVANLEERVDGEDEIDPVVLDELRRRR